MTPPFPKNSTSLETHFHPLNMPLSPVAQAAMNASTCFHPSSLFLSPTTDAIMPAADVTQHAGLWECCDCGRGGNSGASYSCSCGHTRCSGCESEYMIDTAAVASYETAESIRCCDANQSAFGADDADDSGIRQHGQIYWTCCSCFQNSNKYGVNPTCQDCGHAPCARCQNFAGFASLSISCRGADHSGLGADDSGVRVHGQSWICCECYHQDNSYTSDSRCDSCGHSRCGFCQNA